MESPRSEGCRGWRLTAKILGWLWLAIGVVGIAYIAHTRNIELSDVLTFVFDMTIAALWLYGLATNKVALMLISLILSTIQTALCLLMVLTLAIAIGAAVVITDDSSQAFGMRWVLVPLGIAAVLIVIDFSLTCICYIKIRNDVQHSTNPGVKVMYAAAANKC